MRALVVHQPGGPEAMRLQQLPAPQPGPHQVVIAVEAVGVNPVDAGNRADPSWAGVNPPYVVGYELAGRIQAAGDDADWRRGELVWGLLPVRGTRWGTYAELVTLDAALVAPRPPSLSAVQAASLPLTGATSVQLPWRFRRQESVGRWLPARPHSLEDYRAMFEEPERLATTLIVERDGEVIGDLMLKIEDAWAQTEVAVRARGVQAELGWVLDPASTGHGYETEAVRELLRLCFDELDLRRVVAKCFSDNEASWRLMERLGMRRELHAVRESLHRSGEWLDVYGYAMLACERHAKTDAQG
jgi:RimJ/RimL family protein N-acetyltransferase